MDITKVKSIPQNQRVSLELSNSTILTGVVRKHMKRSMKILTQDNMIEFVDYEDIVALNAFSCNDNTEEGESKKCSSSCMDTKESSYSFSAATMNEVSGCDSDEVNTTDEINSKAVTLATAEVAAAEIKTTDKTKYPANKHKKKIKRKAEKIPVILDIETGDPDDILTLMFAACHPYVDLKAVTVTPGSADQIVLIKNVLKELKVSDKNVRLGAQDWPMNRNKKGCVDLDFYSRFLFPSEKKSADGAAASKRKGGKPETKILLSSSRGAVDFGDVTPASQLIKEVCDQEKDISLFTGGPLHNLGESLKIGAHISRWVAQGGFCGDGVVPPGTPTIEKFRGRTHMPTWNFGGSKDSTLLAVSSNEIGRRVLVGKNVCHRCQYNDEFDSLLKSCISGMRPSLHKSALQWIDRVLSGYCFDESRGIKNKKLHDPLAFSTLLDESVCALKEVEVSIKKNAWGSSLCEGTNTFAAVDYSYESFVAALLGG